jgi:hypothetical protein
MSSAPEWVGDSDVLEDLWAEACGYDIPPGLLKKESTTRTFVETKRKAQGNTIIICSHSSFFTLFVVFFLSIVILYSHMLIILRCFLLYVGSTVGPAGKFVLIAPSVRSISH